MRKIVPRPSARRVVVKPPTPLCCLDFSIFSKNYCAVELLHSGSLSSFSSLSSRV